MIISPAAERRKICSPRREPWVISRDSSASRGAAKHYGYNNDCFAPPGLRCSALPDPMAYAMGYRSFAAPRLN